MPNLAVALAENLGLGLYDTFGLQIGSYGVPLVVDFPSLSNATGIQLLGDIKRYHQSLHTSNGDLTNISISFPSLFTLDGLFSMTSNLPFAVNLTTLQSVLAISLAGKISRYLYLYYPFLPAFISADPPAIFADIPSFSMPAIQDIQ